MNNYYKELSLPNVLLDSEKLLQVKRNNPIRGYLCVLTEFEDIINPELLYVFKQFDIIPNALVAFGHENNSDFNTNLNVHTDVIRKDNQWVKVPFAINWEVTDTPVEFKWYDVGTIREVYPNVKDSTSLEYLLANGIHYGERYEMGKPNVSTTFTPIESITFQQNKPVLVNTSIPHGVVYSGYKDRLNVSLRFDTDRFPTWDSILKCLV